MSIGVKILWLVFVLYFDYKIQTEEIQVATKDEPVSANNSAPICECNQMLNKKFNFI